MHPSSRPQPGTTRMSKMLRDGFRLIIATMLAFVPFVTHACMNATVPNPHPLPNESTQFYGDCNNGSGTNGIVVWLQRNIPYDLSCLEDGKYVHVYSLVNTCGKYLPLLPQYCKVGNYRGQCENGMAEGVGVDAVRSVIGSSTETTHTGQFKNGKPNGYGQLYAVGSCGSPACTTSTVGVFENGNLKLKCEGGPDGCANAVSAIPVYEKARQAITAGRCEEALALDRKAQQMDSQKHSASDQENGFKIDFRRCTNEVAFNKAKNSNDPQSIYLAASRYESDGERGRAKALYREIVDRFGNNPIAIKAADRLTRLADVEAVESSNSSAANEVRYTNYRQCQNNRDACFGRCSGIKDSSARSSCQSGCPICAR